MHFIAFQSTYSTIEIGLFYNNQIIDSVSIDKHHANTFIPILEELLLKQKTTLEHISLCVVNRGPSPFTTLRTTIAYANGLQVATKIPLVGMDGLELLLAQYSSNNRVCILLNAFAHDIYFAFKKIDGTIAKGYAKVDELLNIIKKEYAQQPFTVIGNGIPLCQEQLQKTFGSHHVDCGNANISACSIEFLGLQGYNAWKNGTKADQPIMPLYLKSFQIF